MSHRTTRRSFLRTSFTLTGAALLGDAVTRPGSLAAVPDNLAAVPGYRILPFAAEGSVAVGKVLGSGLSGRLALDLTRLDPQNLITPSEQFFIRTRQPQGLEAKLRTPWTVRIGGLVRQPVELSLTQLRQWARPQGTHLAECSGNSSRRAFGLISTARWDGVAVPKILESVAVEKRATRVRIDGFDEHASASPGSAMGAGWIFTFDELEESGAFLATHMNGRLLPPDHGFPLRLVVPGWYGCTWPKWVDHVTLVDDTAPATSQMREYAGRTHQDGVRRLARDYAPARIDQAAMPIRVETWRDGEGQSLYRVVGILWGGRRLTDKLVIRLEAGDGPFIPVESYEHTTPATWTLWTHAFKPPRSGRYRIRLRVDDPAIRTRRLDQEFYLRSVDVGDV